MDPFKKKNINSWIHSENLTVTLKPLWNQLVTNTVVFIGVMNGLNIRSENITTEIIFEIIC